MISLSKKFYFWFAVNNLLIKINYIIKSRINIAYIDLKVGIYYL
jgi:hypothetical protein